MTFVFLFLTTLLYNRLQVCVYVTFLIFRQTVTPLVFIVHFHPPTPTLQNPQQRGRHIADTQCMPNRVTFMRLSTLSYLP